MADHQVAKEFDASGLRCPMPILQTKKQMKTIEIAQRNDCTAQVVRDRLVEGEPLHGKRLNAWGVAGKG